MTKDLIVEMRPSSGNDLRLVLRGLAADELPRPFPVIGAELIEELRAGESSQLVACEVAHQVSEWLLRADLRIHLGYALAHSGPFRVVFRPSEVRLADTLSDIPFELVELEQNDPLALKPTVRAIVHQLPKVGSPRKSPESRAWPLRVLIVRSNPADLGGAVPPAKPIRDEIMALAIPLYGASSVQVRLVSNEPEIGTPATWERVQEELATNAYDILVFLGHGDMAPGLGGLPGSCLLELEEADGKTPRSVSAEQLKVALQCHPVAVVILAGCLTAAQIPAPQRQALKERVPRWMRGNQGVAQALVNSESGVQIAVGMRYRLETADAERFLIAFFKSLLVAARGDVEDAVHAGREALFNHRSFPPAWSAPVIYGAPREEPMFDFLARAPPITDEKDAQDQAYRFVAWNHLSRLPLANRTPGIADPMYAIADEAESLVLQRSLDKQVPVIMPERVATTPGNFATVPVRLHGPLTAEVFAGRVLFSDRSAVAQSCQRSDALKGAGFKALFETGEAGELGFRLERTPGPIGPAPAPLPQETLFSFELPAGAVAERVYTVDVVDLKIEPFHAIRGWSNAVIVSPP